MKKIIIPYGMRTIELTEKRIRVLQKILVGKRNLLDTEIKDLDAILSCFINNMECNKLFSGQFNDWRMSFTVEEMNYLANHQERCLNCNHLKTFHDPEYGCAIENCDCEESCNKEFFIKNETPHQQMINVVISNPIE